MSTGAKKVDIFLKKFLTQDQITENFFDFLENKIHENLFWVFREQGVFTPNVAATPILSSDTDDTFDVTNPLVGIDDKSHILSLDPIFSNNIPFENTVAVSYFVGNRFVQIPEETEINVRTGAIKYTFLTEGIGVRAEPDLVVDDGDETLTIRVDSVTEAGVSNAGRKVKVFLKGDAQNQAQAFEELTVIFSAGFNVIETTTALGQQLGNISTTASDYEVILLGPEVKRNTDLRLDPSVMFLGIITGTGSPSTPSVFDHSDVNNLSVGFSAMIALFGTEHSLVDGTHTDITPQTIVTKQAITGVQLDTQVNAADEDTPDAPVAHSLFVSGGGSGVQGVKWRLRDSGGATIAFIDAHGNAYFQDLAAVNTVFTQNVVVQDSTTLGDAIGTDTVTFNSVLQSLTDMLYVLDSNDDGTGHAHKFYNHSVGAANEIFRIQEGGDIRIFGNIDALNPGLNIDLDTDDLTTGELFQITKDAASIVLLALDENGDLTVLREMLTASGVVYSDAVGTTIDTDASLNETFDETIFRKLLKATPNSPNDTIVNIAAGRITAADGSEYVLPFGQGISNFPSATVNFETGVVSLGPNITPVDFTANDDKWTKYSISLLANNTLSILPSDGVSPGFGVTKVLATNPPLAENAIATVVVAVQNDSGSGVTDILNIAEANFDRLPAVRTNSELIEDTTPQLGGNLDTNGKAILHDTDGVKRGNTGSPANLVEEEYIDTIALLASQVGTVISELTFAHAAFESLEAVYKLKEAVSGDVRHGTLKIVTDGTKVDVTDVSIHTADVEITFNAAVNGPDIEIEYDSGANAITMRADVKRIRA